MAETIYICPRGCDPKFYRIRTLRGFKIHMSGQHGGWSEEELSAAAGTGAPTASAKERMREFTGSLSPAEPEPSSPTSESSGELPKAAESAGPRVRQIKATSKKAKRILTKIPEKFLTANGIELDDDDREGLGEAVEFLEDIFGVAFEVPENQFVIRSRFLALLWPVFIILLIFAKHKLGFKLPISDEEPVPEPIPEKVN